MSKRIVLFDDVLSEKNILIKALENNAVAVPVNSTSFFTTLSKCLRQSFYTTLDIVCHSESSILKFKDGVILPKDWFEQAEPAEFLSINEINFWCCNFADGDNGMKFLRDLSAHVMTKINASTEKVGHPELGGSWSLNVSQSPVPPFEVTGIENWRHTLSTPQATDLSSLVELYNDSNVSSYELGSFFSTYTGVYSVEQTLALMSDRVSGGAPNGVRIEDDATKLYDEFAGIDLAFVADQLVSISATNATAEEAFAISAFTEVINSLKSASSSNASFTFSLDTADTLTNITFDEAMLVLSGANQSATVKSDIVSIKDELDNIQANEFLTGGALDGVSLMLDEVDFGQLEEAVVLTYVNQVEISSDALSTLSTTPLTMSQALAMANAKVVNPISSNFNELTIEDNASEIISNISNFETDLNYLYTAVNDASPSTIVVNGTSVLQYVDNSFEAKAWISTINISDDLSNINSTSFGGANLLQLLQDSGSALSDDRITAVEITDATLNDFETDIKGAIDSGANGTVTVSLELTDSVSKIIEFFDTHNGYISSISDFNANSGTTSPADLGDLLVLSENDVFIAPALNVEAQTTAAELFEFFNDGPDKVSAVRIADSIDIISGDKISISEFNNLKSLETVQFGDDSIDISASAQDVISGESDILSPAVDTVSIDGEFVETTVGVALTSVEENLQVESGNSADVIFNVSDSASAIYNAVSSDSDALDGANSLIVSGGEVTIDEADSIQAIDGYSESGSSYEIHDEASEILGDTSTALDAAVEKIVVDGTVEAGVGVKLGALEDELQLESGYGADVVFEVEDSALDIVNALDSSFDASFNNAEGLSVTSGVLSVSEAAEIQDFHAYDNANSSYTIEDSAADILSYPGVVTDSGVDNIVVTDTVGVADGESLSDLEGIMNSGEMATEATTISEYYAVDFTPTNSELVNISVSVDGDPAVALKEVSSNKIIATDDDNSSGGLDSFLNRVSVESGVAYQILIGEYTDDTSNFSSNIYVTVTSTEGSNVRLSESVVTSGVDAASIQYSSPISIYDNYSSGDAFSSMIDSGGSFESINHRDVDFDVAGNADDILMAGTNLRGATNVFVTDGMLESGLFRCEFYE